MDANAVSAIVVAALGVVATLVQAKARKSRVGGRRQLGQDLEILNLLPTDSESRGLLLKHIDGVIAEIVHNDNELKRDPSGITVATILLILGGILLGFTVSIGRWWYLAMPVVVFFLVFGLYGLVSSLQRKRRDAQGNEVSE